MNDEQRLGFESRIADQAARIAELEAMVTSQAKPIELLLEKLGQNSSNSHLPPSSDGPGAGKGGAEKSRDKKNKRKRGGKKGHRGSSLHLGWSIRSSICTRRSVSPTERRCPRRRTPLRNAIRCPTSRASHLDLVSPSFGGTRCRATAVAFERALPTTRSASPRRHLARV